MADQPCKNPHCKSYGQAHPNCQCYSGMARGGKVSRFCDMGKSHQKSCPLAKGGEVKSQNQKENYQIHSETKDHYVLKHPKGDVLKIAKHGLSPKMHDQIKKFAKGGEVSTASAITQGFTGATGGQGLQQGLQNIKNYDEGTVDEPVPEPAPQVSQEIPEEVPQQQVNREPAAEPDLEPQQSTPAKANQSAEPARVVNPEVMGAIHKMLDVLKAGGPMPYLGDKLVHGAYNAATIPNPDAPQKPSMQQATADQPYSNVPVGAPPEQPKSPTANYPQMPSVDPEVKKFQDIVNSQQGRAQEMHTRAVNILGDLNSQKIDFNRAWTNKSTGSKILAGIGMIFSGIGSGITKQPSMAMEMINREIDRDVDQQKAEMGKKATALDGYLKTYGSETAATNAYREDLQALVAAKMQQYSLKMQGNMMKGMQQGGEQGMGQYLSFLRMTNPTMAKSVEERMIPSLGGAVADTPPTAEDRDSIAKGMELDNVLGQLEQFSKNHSGSLDPRIQNQGKALASRGKELLRQANKQGVFKESEQKFDEGMIPNDPTKFFADYRTLPQYETMKGLNKQSIHNTVGKYFVKNPLDSMMNQQLTHRPGVMPAPSMMQNVSNKH